MTAMSPGNCRLLGRHGRDGLTASPLITRR